MKDGKCQITNLADISHRPSFLEIVFQRIKKLKYSFWRRKNYLRNWIEEFRGEKEACISESKVDQAAQMLQTGDLVIVRSEKEIRKTLNRWNRLKGCGFMEEMWKYCDTKQRVLKPVKQFLDERDYLIKKCRGIVILDGLICEGTSIGQCDRSCYYFWRKEWLEKIVQ